MNFTVPIFLGTCAHPSKRARLPVFKQAIRKFEEYLKIADQQLLKHTYLAGDDFSLADVVLGHILNRYFDIDIERAELSHLRSYYERLTERLQYRTHVMVPCDALRA